LHARGPSSAFSSHGSKYTTVPTNFCQFVSLALWHPNRLLRWTSGRALAGRQPRSDLAFLRSRLPTFPAKMSAAASAPSSILASSALEPIHEGLAFAEVHSQLFLSQKADDPSAEVVACLPPDSMLEREITLKSLSALAALYYEISNLQHSPLRVFDVREGSLYLSLKDHQDADGLEALQTVANYLLLPKEISKALDNLVAVSKVRGDYTAALAAYDVASAIEERPRLFDFLSKDAATKPLVDAGLEALYKDEKNFITTAVCSSIKFDVEAFRDVYKEGREESDFYPYSGNTMMPQAFHDGLIGEPLSEYGYAPSKLRATAYSAACVLMSRAIPWDALGRGHLIRYECKHLQWPYINDTPVRMAACLGKVEVLQELAEHGWSIVDEPAIDARNHYQSTMMPALVEAARCGRLEVLKYAYSLKPSLFIKANGPGVAAPSLVLEAAFRDQVSILRWLLHEVGLAQHVRRIDGTTAIPHRRFEEGGMVAAWVAHHNHLDLLQELHSLGSVLRPMLPSSAAINANTEMLLWLVAQGCKVTEYTVDQALRSGSWDMYHLCLARAEPGIEHVGGGSDWDGLASACVGFNGDTTVLESLMSLRKPGHWGLARLARIAATRGQCSVVSWLQAKLAALVDEFGQGIETREALSFAILGNQLAAVQMLVGMLQSLNRPVRDGDWVVRDLLDVGFPDGLASVVEPLFTSGLLSTKGAAEMEDWLPEWTLALEKNSVAALRWLYRYGGRATVDAVYGTKLARVRSSMLRRLVRHQPYESVVGNTMQRHGAAAVPLLECLTTECGLPPLSRWHKECERVSLTSLCEHAASSGSVELLRYCLDKGCEAGPSVLTAAAENNRVPLLRWLRATFPAWEWPANIVESARKEGADEAASWILEQQAKEKARKEAAAGAGSA
jgi:hypothetical protein